MGEIKNFNADESDLKTIKLIYTDGVDENGNEQTREVELDTAMVVRLDVDDDQDEANVSMEMTNMNGEQFSILLEAMAQMYVKANKQ